MSLKIGIVGLPNVGKSTLFNAMTGAHAPAENYPFCTIEPNVGVVTVPDQRLKQINELIPRNTLIPTTIEFVDIAGLVKGASKGEGLGNQFLSHIRETDAIIQVVRCFTDDNVIHVSGDIDPLRDIEVLETELLLADLQVVEKRYEKIHKAALTSNDKDIRFEFATIEKVYNGLKLGTSVRHLPFTSGEIEIVKSLSLISTKPILYICNVSEADFASGGNAWVKKIIAQAKDKKSESLMISCGLEADIAELSKEEQKEFLQSLGTETSGLERLILSAYHLLELETFFTFNKSEIRAWTITKGTRAPAAAGTIHSDFERGFIRAEVYNCHDLFALKSEAAIKESGKYRSEGKDYVVQDGDVILFRFNV